MSSSVFEVCCCGVDEEDPEVLVVLYVKALPISAPIRDLCALQSKVETVCYFNMTFDFKHNQSSLSLVN